MSEPRAREEFGRAASDLAQAAIKAGVPGETIASDVLALFLALAETHMGRESEMDILYYHFSRLREIRALETIYGHD